MDELVDIVDENDKVIGQELKSICHRDRILHRGGGVLCFKDETYSEILINVRSMKVGVKPGILCTPGGHLAAGESYLDGASREFKEEMLGDKKNNLEFEFLFTIRKDTDNDPEFITFFRTVYPGPFEIDAEEVSDFYFENIELTLKKIKENPEKYIGSTVLVLSEYQKRYLNH